MRILTVFLCLLLSFSTAFAEDITYPTDKLSIKTQNGTVDFIVEVATTGPQMEHGLMNRTLLPEKHGMIFILPKPMQIGFWMKDTLLPLDMFFIDEKGVIITIVEKAKPESTDLIPSGGEARAVIELAGGSAAEYHIAPGDKVLYSIFP